MTEISTEKLQYTGRFHQFGISFRKCACSSIRATGSFFRSALS